MNRSNPPDEKRCSVPQQGLRVHARPAGAGTKSLVTHRRDDLGVYLREIAATPLMSREEELAAAKKVAETRRRFAACLLAMDCVLKSVTAMFRQAANRAIRVDHVVEVQGSNLTARRHAFQRVSAGAAAIQSLLRENESDFSTAPDKRRSMCRRRAAWRRLMRRRRKAARLVMGLRFRVAHLTKAPARLTKMAASLARIQARLDTLKRSPTTSRQQHLLRRKLRTRLHRLMKAVGESPRTLRRRLAAVHRLQREYQEACHAFVTPNLRLVVLIAKRYGARRAASRPDPGRQPRTDAGRREVRLHARTQVLHLRGLLDSSIHQSGNPAPRQLLSPHLPDGRETPRNPRRQGDLLQTHGAKQNMAETADSTGIAADELEILLRLHRRPTSLNRPFLEDDSRELADCIGDHRAEDPSQRLDRELLRQRIDAILQDMDARERQVLGLRFGLVDGQPLSLQDVGKLMHVTRERIRQIERSTLCKLRQPCRARDLAAFLDGPAAGLLRTAHELRRHDQESYRRSLTTIALPAASTHPYQWRISMPRLSMLPEPGMRAVLADVPELGRQSPSAPSRATCTRPSESFTPHCSPPHPQPFTGRRGLVHFSAATQGGQSHIRGGQACSRRHVLRAAKIGTVPSEQSPSHRAEKTKVKPGAPRRCTPADRLRRRWNKV